MSPQGLKVQLTSDIFHWNTSAPINKPKNPAKNPANLKPARREKVRSCHKIGNGIHTNTEEHHDQMKNIQKLPNKFHQTAKTPQ
jgi:hypothetical protein